MGNINETATVEIRLSAEQTKQQIKELSALTKGWKKDLDDASVGDPAKRAELTRQITEAEAKIKQLRASTKENINLIINGEVAGKNLADVQLALRKVLQLRSQLAEDPGSAEFVKLSQQAAVLKQREQDLLQPMKDFQRQLAAAGEEGSLNKLRLKTQLLKEELERLSPASKDFAAKTAEFQKVDAAFQKLNGTLNGTGGLFGFLKSQVAQFGILAAGYLGFQDITSQITNIIKKNADLSDSLADIQMVSGLTGAEVKKLNSELGKIDTRTSTEELRKIAVVAGQFGVAKEDILAFTDAVNKTSVVLSTEFSGGAEEVATSLAKLRNVLTDVKTDQIDKDITHLGNSLIKLAQEGVATAPVIVDFANRIGGTGRQYGLTSGQILGLSATLQELAVTTERGGTAVSRILQKMATNSADFAKVAGVPVKEFQHLINTDIYNAFLKFVEGTKKGGEGAVAFAGILKDAELSGAGAGEVIAKLAANQDLLAKRTALAGEAITKTDSIISQYKLKNETLGAELDKLGKSFYRLVSGNGIQQMFSGMVSGARNAIEVLGDLPNIISKNSTALFTLIGATAAYNSQLIYTTVSAIANTTAELANTAWRKAKLTINGFLVGAELAYGYALDAATGKIKVATAAQKIWNLVASENPLGAIIVAFTAVIGAIELYRKNTTEAIQLERDKVTLDKELTDINLKLGKSVEEINVAVENYNRLSPIEQENLRNTIKLKREEAEVEFERMKKEQDSVQQRSSTISSFQFMWNVIKSGGDVAAGTIANVNSALDNGKDAAGRYDEKINGLIGNIKTLSDDEKKLLAIQNAEKDAMAINALTTDQYNEKLKLLRVALNAAVVGSADYIRIQKEINETQNKLSGTSNLSEAELTKLNEFKNKVEAMYAQLRDLQTASIRDAAAKELAMLDDKYQKENAAAQKALNDILIDSKISDAQKAQARKATNDILTQLDATYYEDVRKLREKNDKEIKDAGFDQNIKNIQNGYLAEKVLLTNQYAEGKLSKEQYNDDLAALDKKLLDDTLQLQKDYGKDSLETEQAIANAKADAHEKGIQKIVNAELINIQTLQKQASDGNIKSFLALQASLKAERDAKLSQLKEGSEEYIATKLKYDQMLHDASANFVQVELGLFEALYSRLSSIVSSFVSSTENKENAALAADKARNDKRKSQWQAALDAKRITQEQYNKQAAKLDAEYDAREHDLKKKQFERNKKMAIATAIINGIVSVVKTLSEYPYPINLVLAALDAVVVGAQVAQISSTQFTGAKGGILPGKGGVTQGASHSEGGIRLIDTKSGEQVGEIEGGEPILSGATYANNKELVDALLETSRNGGGTVALEDRRPKTGDGRVGRRETEDGRPKIEVGRRETGQSDGTGTTDAKALVNKDSKPSAEADGNEKQPRGEIASSLAMTDGGESVVNKESAPVQPIVLDAKALVNRIKGIDDMIRELTAKALVNRVSGAVVGQETQPRAAGVGESLRLPNQSGHGDGPTTTDAKALVNRIPQINSKQVVENMNYQRFGGMAQVQAQAMEQLRVVPPSSVPPNNDNVTMDVFQQQLLKTMQEVQETMVKVRESHEQPKLVEAYVVLQKMNDQIALSERVKQNAKIG
jgi:TP901 family phage tail tape measure protein